MLLAIDTSAGTSVALFRDGVLAAELNVTDNMKHAETVGTAIISVLTQAGVAAREVQEVVVGRGPAPFTGLRVGIAAAVMFAEGSGAKLSGLVSLDAIALTALKQRPASETRPLLVTTDARRSEVYWALYSGLSEKGVAVRTEGPQVLKPAALEELLAARNIDADTTNLTITGSAVGELALALRAAGQLERDISALYLRAPDAVEPKASGVFGKRVSS
ncbi:MAG: tRNA (adenosine(37)-N6)-threonylcarbamoyltransferase complex dimerization subunit type 1 TsaB [Actinobacteria bacterium]|nr:tRNA (adenosine(37)-N6)-threonylcarbamoyltransferase complex dimerization subunit type 1 TsaB [Actinomycetota bacterium]